MKVLVIDGQGGGLGKALIAAFAKAFPTVPLIALGTNSLATSAMLRAGAAAGATGEHAIAWQARDADLILGAAGILIVGAMMGGYLRHGKRRQSKPGGQDSHPIAALRADHRRHRRLSMEEAWPTPSAAPPSVGRRA